MIAILSDIHGNYEALQSVLQRLEHMGVRNIVCLGDVAGYYCQINECCDLLRKLAIPVIMGNHDWYLASGEACPRSNSVNICLDYQRKVISDTHLQWLRSLPPVLDAWGISFRHGGWLDPLDEYVRLHAEYFAGIDGQLFVSGHTHVPCLWENGAIRYCNPGSVGQPRDGNPDASFALYEQGNFSLQRTAYDIEKMQTTMRQAGFSEYYYANLASGSRIGGKIDSAACMYGL